MRVPGDQSSVSSLPASMYFHQPEFDRRLRMACAGMPNVTVHLGAEAREFSQRDDHVAVTAVGPGGNARTVTASWLVGCDGASSLVRESAGITLDDLRFEERWLVVDLLLHGEVPALPDRAVTVCDPRRPLYSIPMPGPRHRFEFMLRDQEDAAAAQTRDNVMALISPWIAPGLADVERVAVYTFHGLVADSWRRGRLLIAGDAAHQMPPFLGQGMCSGIRDAANLAWKLENVILRGASTALLDTYGQERRPHVRSIVESAVDYGRVICTVDPAVAAERDRQFLEHPADPAQRIPFALPDLAPGPLVLRGGGELFLQPASDNGDRRFDDVVGPRFLVLGRDGGHLTNTASWWARSLGAHVAVLADLPRYRAGLQRWMDARAADVVVVRPDRYVLAADGDLEAITGAVAGLLAAPGPVHQRSAR
jgi:3-(3-hydroxy-phenyl)propionate hydroxylase